MQYLYAEHPAQLEHTSSKPLPPTRGRGCEEKGTGGQPRSLGQRGVARQEGRGRVHQMSQWALSVPAVGAGRRRGGANGAGYCARAGEGGVVRQGGRVHANQVTYQAGRGLE